MTPTQLLNESNKRLADRQNKVLLCPYKRITTLQGYSFIKLNEKEAKPIVAAVQLDVSWNHEREIGYLKEISCSIDTQEKIIGNYCILYQDAVIFINDFSGYTESMKQFQYRGKAVPIDKLPLIKKLSAKETYGYSIMDLLVGADLDYDILPEHLALNEAKFNKGVFLIDIQDSQDITLIAPTEEGLEQIKTDTVSFNIINVTRTKVMEFIYELLEYGKNNNLFGLIGNYSINEVNSLDDFSNLKGIRYEVKVDLCYNIKTIKQYVDKYIRIIMFKINV